MSECRNENIKCPRCGYESPMTIWNSINVDLDPELKEKLLSQELFEWKCEVCGLETHVHFGTIYHDMKHHFMLFFDPLDEDDREMKYKETEIPLPPGMISGDYVFRSVYGLNQLREKIAIFEAGLNDVAVERMKFFIKLNETKIMAPTDQLYFLEVDTDTEKIKSTGWERGAIKFVRVREGHEPDIHPYQMEVYYDYLLATDVDPRMKVNGCTCVDQEWLERKLK